MRAFDKFMDAPAEFWPFIKFISEQLGYSKRGSGTVRKYTKQEIENLCRETHTRIDNNTISDALTYTNMRADLLNNDVQNNLMDAETARRAFESVYPIYKQDNLQCKLPLNKQKGAMKQIAYFTAIINILAEKTIREIKGNTHTMEFDDDPRGLTYIWDRHGNIIGGSSRRFDGAYPGIQNPSIVWEIKEYYYATTFGSRVADGVYETQLDGYEFKDLFDRTGYKVHHILFLDAYRTWWTQGKSYLCRIIDALNSRAVDEVIVGQEVFERWPELLRELI
ncbi:DUF7687 domain-containing protein [Anaerostipes sp.]|uniref:DUF7687 domain-containing protein n=1 Tax=Anaerostipes sp. TaxID=1872530 RepID=UPI0025B8BFA4|nr:hypothetical protein [Anaerostipes sp.]MBS7006793.1 hypothetical protein [Anaerostipes sp.]